MAPSYFRDREDAGRRLATALARYAGSHPLVLGIPRGGVPVAKVVAGALGGELDVVLVRKLGAPGNPELAVGAIDEDGRIRLNAFADFGLEDSAYLRREAQRQLALIRERRAHYRPGRAAAAMRGRTVIVVDDGLATGATMAAALEYARSAGAGHLVCAVPVASRESLAEVSQLADEVECLATPSPFHAVGLHYRDFSAVDDDEVVAMLGAASKSGAPAGLARVRPVQITAGAAVLEGELAMPVGARGLVVFAHGSGSSRLSARNRAVAAALNGSGLATLLFDLLTAQEDRSAEARFDIPFLGRRLEAAMDWVALEPAIGTLPLGLFGASTGAAAALVAAARQPTRVLAVVSRGGRPDLAGPAVLASVQSHTLLIVGGADVDVLRLNRQAQAILGEWAELSVVPGASHLFEEPGALEAVATIAADWFCQWLRDGADHDTRTLELPQ